MKRAAVALIGVAIAIPEPYGSDLQRERGRFGDPLAGAIPTHVTLLPPTEVDTGDLPKAELHLEDIAAGLTPFEMHLLGTDTFRPVSPVVFVRVARGAEDCEQIEGAVRSGPLNREVVFGYHPHVTIAHHLPDETLDRACDELATYDACFAVASFSLYRHGSDGVWRPDRTFAFGRGTSQAQPS